MLLIKKIDEIHRFMRTKQLDILILGPSPDLQYLTGLHPFGDERFKGLFICADKRYFFVTPELYYEETREVLGDETDIFQWSDSAGFLAAVKEANAKYRLRGRNIGVNDGITATDLLDLAGFVEAKFYNGSGILESVRMIKSEQEKENLRQAARIADQAGREILNYIQPGRSEKEIKKKLEELLLTGGGQELAFEPIAASGPNTSKPHYNGDSRLIEKNDLLILDYGCKYNGYCSDISRTVFIGEPSDEQKKIYNIVLEANLQGEACVRQGARAEEVDQAARKVITDAGYGRYFLNRTGHGIGTAVHESPYIRGGNKLMLEDGMAFSVEPGIYISGRFGMRVEDIVLVDGENAEILNKLTKEMIIIK